MLRLFALGALEKTSSGLFCQMGIAAGRIAIFVFGCTERIIGDSAAAGM